MQFENVKKIFCIFFFQKSVLVALYDYEGTVKIRIIGLEFLLFFLVAVWSDLFQSDKNDPQHIVRLCQRFSKETLLYL